jgi:hypothetical protein
MLCLILGKVVYFNIALEIIFQSILKYSSSYGTTGIMNWFGFCSYFHDTLWPLVACRLFQLNWFISLILCSFSVPVHYNGSLFSRSFSLHPCSSWMVPITNLWSHGPGEELIGIFVMLLPQCLLIPSVPSLVYLELTSWAPTLTTWCLNLQEQV